MGTPSSELESKYFTDGEARARGRESKNARKKRQANAARQLSFADAHLDY